MTTCARTEKAVNLRDSLVAKWHEVPDRLAPLMGTELLPIAVSFWRKSPSPALLSVSLGQRRTLPSFSLQGSCLTQNWGRRKDGPGLSPSQTSCGNLAGIKLAACKPLLGGRSRHLAPVFQCYLLTNGSFFCSGSPALSPSPLRQLL